MLYTLYIRALGILFMLLLLLFSFFLAFDSFVAPRTAAHQASLSVGFPREEYRSGLPFSSPGDLPAPGIKPRSPHWQADSLPLSHQGRHSCLSIPHLIFPTSLPCLALMMLCLFKNIFLFSFAFWCVL